MARRERDTSKKRNSIIDAAIKAFQEEGYDKTSMDRIAEVAGASKRTVYNHFASKEELFGAVVDLYMSEATALKEIPYDSELTLEEQLTEFAAAKMKLLDDPDWTGFMRVGLGVLVRDPELGRATIARATAGEDHLATWLEAATSDGRIHVENSALAAELFWAAVSGAFFWPTVLGSPPEPTRVEAFTQELIRTFLARYVP